MTVLVYPRFLRGYIFGSFLDSENPDDIDVAIFQDSGEAYLP